MKPLFVYTTFPNTEMASSVAEALLKKHLVACANVIPAVKSFYMWEGQMRNETEIVMIIKTTTDKYDAMEKEIIALHSYDIPCIVALPIETGHEPYLQWVAIETKSKA